MNKNNRIRKISIIIFLILLASIFFTLSCSKPKVYRVGILSGLNLFAETIVSFKERMTELGYIEDKNILYDVQNTDFDMKTYDSILKKFVANKVNLIFVFPTEAAMQAKAVTQGTGIPVVFANAYTENTNLINSIQEPGGNITGIRWPGPEIAVKTLQVMQKLVPHINRILIAYQKDYPTVKSQLEVLGPAVLSAGITVVEIPASNAKELAIEIRKLPGPFNADVIQLLAEPLIPTSDGFTVLSKFAAQHKILIGGTAIFEGDYQSVFAFVPDIPTQGKEAANMADKIFKGTPAGKILVVTAPYMFYFNYKQAQNLGIEVKEDLLSQADIIIR